MKTYNVEMPVNVEMSIIKNGNSSLEILKKYTEMAAEKTEKGMSDKKNV